MSLSRPAVYVIRHQSGRIYVGAAANFMNRRNVHRYRLRKGRHSAALQADFDRDGMDAFTFEVLEWVDIGDLLAREQHHLDALQPFGDRGYNIVRFAGGPRGMVHGQEMRDKLSAAHSGRVQSAEWVAKRNRREHSPEERAKRSATMRQRWAEGRFGARL